MMWFCERLSLRAMKSPCAANKNNGTFACSGCSGAVQEDGEMAKNRCNIPGCEKLAQVKGMCKAHANGTPSRPSRHGVAVVDEMHTINLLQVIRDKRQADLDALMVEIDLKLAKIPTAAGKIVFCADYL